MFLQDCADAGWWMGEIGGRQGVFPDNFVKLLELEKEVKIKHTAKENHNMFSILIVFVFPETKETSSPGRTFNQTHPRYCNTSPLRFCFFFKFIYFIPEVEKKMQETSKFWPVEKKVEVKKVPPERPEHLPQRDQDRGRVWSPPTLEDLDSKKLR